MDALQHGVLQWIAAGLIFAIGVLFGRLIERGRCVEERIEGLVDSAERLGEEDGLARKYREEESSAASDRTRA